MCNVYSSASPHPSAVVVIVLAFGILLFSMCPGTLTCMYTYVHTCKPHGLRMWRDSLGLGFLPFCSSGLLASWRLGFLCGAKGGWFHHRGTAHARVWTLESVPLSGGCARRPSLRPFRGPLMTTCLYLHTHPEWQSQR